MNDKKNNIVKPPWTAEKLLKIFLRNGLKKQRVGEFGEIFEYIADKEGIHKAKLWYWGAALKSIPYIIYDSIYWGGSMFANYLKLAFRNIRKHKINSFINMFSLVVGIVSCILIALWVIDELSYDKFHNESDSIYQVLISTYHGGASTTPVLLGQKLQDDVPEIISYSRYHWLFEGAMLNYEDKSFYESKLRLVDPAFLDIFTFPFIRGNKKTAFNDPYSMVITKSIAEKYFGSEDPVGKSIILNQSQAFTITGLIDDVPKNSTLEFDILIPMQYNLNTQKKWYTDWNNLFVMTFVKTQPGCNLDEINYKIGSVMQTINGSTDKTIKLLPFTERRFEFFTDINDIYMFSTIAVLILIIACINFINLSTARSLKRAKEIGLRKVIGANRKNIIAQFLGETLLIIFIAFALSMLLVSLLFPTFNSLIDKELTFNGGLLILLTFSVTLIAGLIGTIYPAFYLASFLPINALQDKVQTISSRLTFRKILVTAQFTLSIILLISIATVYTQMNYLTSQDIGYKNDHLIRITSEGGSEQYFNLFKGALEQNPNILGVTGSQVELPFFSWHINGFKWEGKDTDQNISVCYNNVGFDFAKTFNLKIKEGRDFSNKIISDLENAYIINEEMAKLLGGSTVVGKQITLGDETRTVIGVVKDFHFNSFDKKIEPLILGIYPDAQRNIYVKISGADFASTKNFIEETWDRLIPSFPFEYKMMDEEFNSAFEDTEQTAGILNSFALIALIISGLGLLGLSAFSAEQRVKEIGIRKVLGSSSLGILLLLQKEYLKYLLIANIIAWPLGYYFMSVWLQDFAYRVNLDLWPFVFAAVAAAVISIITVSYHSIKAATANPIDSIKYE